MNLLFLNCLMSALLKGVHTANWFLQASVEMYIFMATGENYAELVNQVRLGT